MPLSSETIELVNRKVPINIELKGRGTANPVANMLNKYVKGSWGDSDFLVSSFNHAELAEFIMLMPAIRSGAQIVGIPTDYAAFAEKIGAYSVNPSVEFINEEFINDAHSRNLKVFVFTVNDDSEVRRMQSMRVDAIFTNYPDKARSYLV